MSFFKFGTKHTTIEFSIKIGLSTLYPFIFFLYKSLLRSNITKFFFLILGTNNEKKY